MDQLASSELESSILVEYTGDAVLDTDYSVSSTVATIPAGQQKTTVTLTGIDDTLDETIELINLNLALVLDGDGNSISNVDIGAVNSATFEISDDEAPVVTFETSLLEISENGGSVTVTANLSNTKLTSTSISLDLAGSATQSIDYSTSSLFDHSVYAGSINGDSGTADGNGLNARFDEPVFITKYIEDSFLVYDWNSRTIRKVDSSGNVTTIVGTPYQNEVSMNYAMVADITNENIFWSANDILYGINMSPGSDGVIREWFNNSGSPISGLTLHNGRIYYSSGNEHTLNVLTWNGSRI